MNKKSGVRSQPPSPRFPATFESLGERKLCRTGRRTGKLKILEILLLPDYFLARGCVWLIRGYQRTVSPDHSELGKTQPFCGCRYYPSCSEYGILVLEKYGFVFGVPRIIWRVIRCNPFSKGGVDSV